MKLLFAPDGTIRSFYTDEIPLTKLGQVTVTRASTVEWDDKRQEWDVKDAEGNRHFSHASRAECVAWELENMELPA